VRRDAGSVPVHKGKGRKQGGPVKLRKCNDGGVKSQAAGQAFARFFSRTGGPSKGEKVVRRGDRNEVRKVRKRQARNNPEKGHVRFRVSESQFELWKAQAQRGSVCVTDCIDNGGKSQRGVYQGILLSTQR